MLTSAAFSRRASRRITWSVLFGVLAIGSGRAFAQWMPIEVIPGTWALEPYWPALQNADAATVQSAFADLLESVDDPLNDPERLTVERALALALYFQDRAPDMPCAGILEEFAQANLPQNEVDQIADSVHSIVGCPEDGVVDPEDVSERPIWSPFRPGYAWCTDSNSDGMCDAWYHWYRKPIVSGTECCWNCVATGIVPGQGSGCLIWEYVDCGGENCGQSACSSGPPCETAPPLWDDTIEPSVGRPDPPPPDDNGSGLEGSDGGGDGDDGSAGGGGAGGGNESGSTDGSVAEADAGEGSQNADLEQHATTVSTCNPVLVSDGFRIEKEVDLVVPLTGRDFKLYRTYNGSHLVRNDAFPWAMGSGWSTSADAWICYQSRGELLSQSPLGDMVDLTIFPVETSTQYLDPIPDRTSGEPEYLRAIGTGDSRFRKSTWLDAEGNEFGVYILEAPGKGHSVFVRAPDGADNMHELDGRLIEQRDEYDNLWKYEYTRFTYPSGALSKPKLYRILLGGDTPATAEAVVYFSWYLGDEGEPGTGKLKKVEVARRYERTLPSGLTDVDTVITHRVKYTYLSNLERHDQDNQETTYLHLYDGRVDDPVLVEQSVLLNAPVLEEDWEERLDAPEAFIYHTRYWHYRHGFYDDGSKMQTLDYVFEPTAVEHLAGALGCSLEQAVETLLRTDMEGSFPGLVETPKAFVSKAVSYYGSGDHGDGYYVGELVGRVKRQVLRSGCSCSGGVELSRSEHFRYAKRVVPLPQWEVTSLTTIYPTRESRLTERTDCVWDPEATDNDLFADENWIAHKTARSWSEEVEIVRGKMSNSNGSWTSWKMIKAPFVIADEIVEEVGAGRSAASVHVFEFDPSEAGAFQRVLRLHSEAIAGFDTYVGHTNFADGLLVFDASAGEDAYDAVTWSGEQTAPIGDGMAEWWVYDRQSRLTDYGVARGWVLDNGDLRKPDLGNLPSEALHLKHHAYVVAEPLAGPGHGELAPDEIWFTRSDLLTSTT